MINELAELEYRKMGKDKADFIKLTNGLKYGVGITRIKTWDKEKNLPVTESIDPRTALFDPQEFYGESRRYF
jgi:hypothetical protein